MRKKSFLLLFGGSLLIITTLIWQEVNTNTSAAQIPAGLPPNHPWQEGSGEATPEATVPPDTEDVNTSPTTEEDKQPSDAYCLLCHSNTERTQTFPSGETISLNVDTTILAQSVHGTENSEGALACADCHTNQRFPHSKQANQSFRDFRLERYASCRNCHEDEYLHAQDSVHGSALREGVVEAAVCVDCHGSHDVQPPDEPRGRISLTCGQCHGAIFEEYRQSVHGTALLDESNPDVPTCIDCHGVHDIQNPTTALFRVRSPQLCADCHADKPLMDKYDLTTNVFESYLTDFHGSTIAIFEQEDPESASNKAVCYDCHGVHNIAKTDSENSRVIKENLLTTCQQCHPGATANFSDAWVGHFEPTAESNPLLYGVNLFYKILIPLVLGGFGVLIVSDIFGRVRLRLRKGGKHE